MKILDEKILNKVREGNLKEMPHIAYDDKGIEKDFDFEWEGKSVDEIIQYLNDAFHGEKVKDKYGNILNLKTREDKVKVLEGLKNSAQFQLLFKNKFSKTEQDLLTIILTGALYK